MNHEQSRPQLSGVPRTMLLTLRWRSDEQARSRPLFSDPLAVEWSKALPWDEGLDPMYNKSGSQDALAVRTYHLDRAVSGYISNHQQPVVVELGAGLSTRYHRIGSNVYRWFDLDLPVVIDLRRQLDTQTEQHQFISSSVLDFSWMDALPEVPPENILFMTEGLLYYLDLRDVQRLINEMRARFPGATLLMDLMGENTKLFSSRIKQLERLGAPFKWYVKDERDVAAMGLSIVKVSSIVKLARERWPFGLKLLSLLPPLHNNWLIIEAALKQLE